MKRRPATLPRGLRWFGRAFNALPRRWRRRGTWRIYFADGKLSAVSISSFDG